MKSLAELQAFKAKMQGQVDLRNESHAGTRVVVGMATCGIAAGARPVLTALSDLVQEHGIKDVSVTQTGCIGLCQYEPIVEVITADGDKTTYIKMTAEKAKKVVEQHLMRGIVVAEYTINNSDLAK